MSARRIETGCDECLGMYVAMALDLHCCTGLGRTPEGARRGLELAISLWFDPMHSRLRESRGRAR